MTADEKRSLVISQAKPAIGRNRYDQNSVKRECVFTPYVDGKYYSDCSSFVRWLYRKAGLYTNIGGNTVGIMNSKLGVEIDCKIKSGVPTDISALRVGDLFLFRGNDKSRSASRYVGHVEIVSAIKGNKVTLMGHGSGTPKMHSMTSYCRTRWLTLVANTKIKNRGLICVKRFIPDDVKIEPAPADPMKPTPSMPGVLVTGNNVNIRSGPGTSYDVVKVVSNGTVLPLVNAENWRPVLINGEIRWISEAYSKVVDAK